MEKKQYYEKLDLVRGIAIFLVILGHCIQCGSGSAFNQAQLFFDDPVFRFIYSFHMPLFMILSGFLYGRNASGRPFWQTLKNRSLRLLLPIAVWETLIRLASLLRGGGFDLGGWLYSIVTGFWFLWAVWWATVACALIEALGKSAAKRAAFHAALVALSLFTPDGVNFSLYKFMYVSFLLGYAAARGGWDRRFDGARKDLYLAALAALFAALFALYRREAFIYISGWTLLGREKPLAVLAWDLYRTVTGAVGSAAVIGLAHRFAGEGKARLLVDLGRNSGGIYILQTFANVVMMKFLAGIGHRLWLNLAEALLICAGCYLAVKLLGRIPFVSPVLFGQKTDKRAVIK